MTVVRWLCYHPIRLVLLIVVVALVAVPVAILAGGDDGPPAAPPTVAATPPPINPDAAVDTAVAFVDSWCTLNGRTPQQWLSDVQGRSAAWFARYFTLAHADETSGDCPYGQAKPRWSRPDQVRVFVVTRGNPVLVDVVREDGRLVVAGITPDEEGGD
jgi:hypothetical protein